MQREDVEQAEHAILVEEHEADEHHAAGEHVRDVEVERSHQKLRETKSSSVASRPSMSASTEKFGHAEDPHLGDRGLEQREEETADDELARHSLPGLWRKPSARCPAVPDPTERRCRR